MNKIIEIYKYGFTKYSYKPIFYLMTAIFIWALCGLTFMSHTAADIIMNIIQLIMYGVFMWNMWVSYNMYNEYEKISNKLKNYH